MLPFGSKNLKELVENWNRAIPIDKWYREKYNIPFNSSAHRQICLADMFFDFWESISTIQNKNKKESKQKEYIRGKGNFMKEIVYSQKDIDDLFDKLDIDSID